MTSSNIIVSERHGHMLELAQEMDLDYDAIVILSGDGGIHEVINGLAKHTEPHKALRIPIAQIPTGSANALSINHFGAKVRDAVHMRAISLIHFTGWF